MLGMMRLLLRAMIAWVLTLPAFQCAAPAQANDGPPNIAIIIADDMGFSDLGCYGGEIETPNLDRLASDGLRFTQFYNTARCWPTRACILTGYYAQQVRMDPPKGRLPSWARVLPHYLKPLGYRSYHSGKWHLRGAPRPVADGGFDRSYLVADQDRFFSPKRTSLDDERLPPVEEGSGYYATTAIADYGLEFLREHAEQYGAQPFFLYLAFTSPHFPLHAIQEDIDRYRDRYLVGWDVVRRRRFRRLREAGIVNCDLSQPEPETIPHWNFPAGRLLADIGPGEAPRAVPWNELSGEQRAFQATKMAIHAAMIDRMDREIGRVLDQLKAMGAYQNTAIFFLSDNGASAEQIIRGDMHDPAAPPGSAKSYLCLGPGWSTAANTPFRRHKSWVHEGGIATPLIVHWPEGISARGQLRHDLGHCIDFVPTVLELAGGKAAAEQSDVEAPPLPGKSLVPALARDGTVEREFLFFSHGGNQAVRVGNWKLVSARDDDAWQLYDLSIDRCESADLSARHPERARRLETLWKELDARFRRQAAKPESEHPAMNVLFIAVDDLRPTLGCYGDQTAITPNIDRLAGRGTVFNRAYCQEAVCSPSRLSLMTGRRPDTIRVWDLATHFREAMPNVVTLPQHFKAHGYHTRSIGKIYHGSGKPAKDPPSWSQQPLYDTTRDASTRYALPENLAGAGLKRSATEAADVPDDTYIDGIVCDAAVKALGELKAGAKPFFLAVGFRKPHLPFCAPKKYWDLYDRANVPPPATTTHPKGAPELAVRSWKELEGYTDIPDDGQIPPEKIRQLRHGYYACVSYVDALVGRLVDQLQRLDLADNTVIVLWGDHGYHLGEQGLWTKANNFELSTRVPLILSVPGQSNAGSMTDALVELVDVYPTLVEICGLDVPEGLEGISMMPLLQDPDRPWKTAAFSQYPRDRKANRHRGHGDVMGCAVRTRRYRYVEWRDWSTKEVVARELYDHVRDPHEMHNVADRPEHASIVRRLAGVLDGGWKSAGPQPQELRENPDS